MDNYATVRLGSQQSGCVHPCIRKCAHLQKPVLANYRRVIVNESSDLKPDFQQNEISTIISKGILISYIQ